MSEQPSYEDLEKRLKKTEDDLKKVEDDKKKVEDDKKKAEDQLSIASRMLGQITAAAERYKFCRFNYLFTFLL